MTSHALVTVPPLRPRRRVPSKPDEDETCCLRPQLAGSASGLASVEATSAFTLVAARSLACHPQSGVVDGLQLTRFPSWLPSKLRGLWFFPRWVYLPPSVLAFWSYKLTKPGTIGASQPVSRVFGGQLAERANANAAICYCHHTDRLGCRRRRSRRSAAGRSRGHSSGLDKGRSLLATEDAPRSARDTRADARSGMARTDWIRAAEWGRGPERYARPGTAQPMGPLERQPSSQPPSRSWSHSCG